MKRSKIIYCSALALAAAACLFLLDRIATMFVALLVLFALAVWFLLLGTASKLQAGFVKQSLTAEKNAGATAQIRIFNNSGVPFPHLRLGVQVREDQLLYSASCPEKSSYLLQLDLPDAHIGRYFVKIPYLDLYDVAGLTKKRIKMEQTLQVTIAPRRLPMKAPVSQNLLRPGAASQSAHIAQNSRLHVHDNTGEISELREYRPGDNLRDVHWKLTGKFDTLMVRQYMPQNQNRLCICLDIYSGVGQSDGFDGMVETALALASNCVENALPCVVSCYDPGAEQVLSWEIDTVQDYETLFESVLSLSRDSTDAAPPNAYYETLLDVQGAGVCLVAASVPDQLGGRLRALAEAVPVYMLLCEEPNAPEAPDGIPEEVRLHRLDCSRLREDIAELDLLHAAVRGKTAATPGKEGSHAPLA